LLELVVERLNLDTTRHGLLGPVAPTLVQINLMLNPDLTLR